MTNAELIAILHTLPPEVEAVTVDANGGVTAITGAGLIGYASHEDDLMAAIAVFQDLDGTLGWESTYAED